MKKVESLQGKDLQSLLGSNPDEGNKSGVEGREEELRGVEGEARREVA